MSKTYTLELKFTLTDEQQQKIVEAARRVYAAGSPSIAYEGETERELKSEEFIEGPGSALLHLLDQNTFLEELGIQPDEVSHTEPDYEAEDDDDFADELEEESTSTSTGSSADDDLDDWSEGLYLCRWPNGEFSVVKADSKRDALVQLDEWAGAEAEWLVPLETFMADFRLDDDGQIELNSFGEETRDFIRTHCYPELDAVLTSPALTSAGEEHSAAQKKMIREAVERERTRLWHLQPKGPDAKTEFGKDLQKSMGTTGVVADHYVDLAGKHILRSIAGEGKKPN
ncbi:MAG: hypothetical protein WA324_24940 [Bryobacteraceae bacterium]